MISRLKQYRLNWKALGLRLTLMLVTITVIVVLTGAYRNQKLMLAIVGGVLLFSVIGMVFHRLTSSLEPTVWPNTFRRLDDRGAPVVVGDVRLKDMRLNQVESILVTVWVSKRKMPLLNRTSVGIGLWALFFAAWLAWLQTGSKLLGHDPALYLGIFVMFSIGYILSRIQRRNSLKLNSEGVLFAGRCPACGYDLKTVRRDPDGCTVCTECGAAWRLGSMTLSKSTAPSDVR